MKLPKIDTLIVFVFILCIALWAMSKCGSRRTDYLKQINDNDEQREERPVKRDTIVLNPQPQQQTPLPAPMPTPQPGSQPAAAQPAATAPANPGVAPKTPQKQPSAAPQQPVSTKPTAAKPTTNNNSTRLFVTIDGLKMRKEPGLKAPLVAKLSLFEEVTYLNQRTDWTQEISLGYEKVTDRWVKVRTKSGKEGWVFGAGVNYYKEKRKGVME